MSIGDEKLSYDERTLKNSSTHQQVFVFVFKDRVSVNHGILKGRRKESTKVGDRKGKKTST